MPNALITLTTDFGEDSPYVAALKGSVLSVNPTSRILDLSHHIPAQDLRHTSFFLWAAVPYFPQGVLHVVVVDPGVGSERALLYVEVASHRLLVPDNGCWTELAGRLAAPPLVRRLEEPRFWRPQVSNTFHGRDILAPVAGHLSAGLDPAELGTVAPSWVRLNRPEPFRSAEGIAGEVWFIDHFGNLITNIRAETISPESRGWEVAVGDKAIGGLNRTYSDAPAETPIALVSSEGMVEIGVNRGNAARELGAGVGTPVTLRRPG